MKTRIDKDLALVLFVHNLADWHVSCTSGFLECWSSFPSRLNSDEKKALFSLGELFKGYLATNDELWIKEVFKDGKVGIPIEVKFYFDLFKPRFEFFYKRQEENMKKVAKYLDNLPDKYEQKLKMTKEFYNFKEKINIFSYLTLSCQANKQAGGMLVEREEEKGCYVIMEYGDYNLGDNNWTIDDVFLHELTHVYQCFSGFKEFVKKRTKGLHLSRLKKMNVSTEDFLTEVIHASLWGSCGYFSEKVFGEVVGEGKGGDGYKMMVQKVVERLRPKIARYIEKGKGMDENLINEAAKLLAV